MEKKQNFLTWIQTVLKRDTNIFADIAKDVEKKFDT